MADVKDSAKRSEGTSSASERWRRMCQRHPGLDRLDRAFGRYHERQVSYFALRVNLRGLFLAVTTMLTFIWVMAAVTTVLPGDNELTVPTVDVPASVDLGSILRQSVMGASGHVVGLTGLAALLLSAFFTGRAMREATAEVFGTHAPERKALWLRDVLRGLLVAVLVLVSWLLVLGTAIRTRVIVTVSGLNLDRSAVNFGKAALLLISVVLLATALYVSLRRISPDTRTSDFVKAAVFFGVFMTLANLVLLYAYIASIIDPRTASGVVLVLTLLAWVNLMVRALFVTQCWLCTDPAPTETA